jgi:tight adherence protein C
MLIQLAAAVCFAAAVFLGARRFATHRQLRASLDRASRSAVALQAPVLAVGPRGLPGAAALVRLALLARPGITQEDVAARLAAAGLRISPERYLALQGSFVFFSLAVGASLLAAGSAALGVVAAASLLAAAVLGPERLLAARAARRRAKLLAALPGTLDLLAVCVEAGLGFDASLSRVAAADQGPLADELSRVLGELRLGHARSLAMEHLAERAASPEVAAFARAVVRADELGTPLAATLRAQAADARSRRQLAAEEAAGKAPVKLVFPTVFFIFPALFTVILGPAVIEFARFMQ